MEPECNNFYGIVETIHYIGVTWSPGTKSNLSLVHPKACFKLCVTAMANSTHGIKFHLCMAVAWHLKRVVLCFALWNGSSQTWFQMPC